MRYRILCLGDSILAGARDPSGGWVDHLRRNYNQRSIDENLENSYQIFNLGISGETSEKLLNRIEFENQNRTLNYEKKQVINIIGCGINDSQLYYNDNSSRIDIDTFTKNILKLIDISQQFAFKTYFVGLTPVIEKKVNPLMIKGLGVYYKNDNIQIYDNIIETQCHINNIGYIKLYDKFNKLKNKENYYIDGLHLNKNGSKIIYTEVKTILNGIFE